MNQALGDISVGIDIEENKRFSSVNKKKDANFLRKIFTPEELAYCFSKHDPTQHLTVRFAAKEAIIKAISSLGDKKPVLNTIEIRRNKEGIPQVNLKPYEIKISLSHSTESSVAIAIVARVN